MTTIRLRRWSELDAPLLAQANSDAMTRFLAGPETDEQVARRHENYLRYWLDGSARMFVVVEDDEPVGGIGWWWIDREGVQARETGWFVLPHAQGRGIAGEAVRLIIADVEREASPGDELFAFPAVENLASNALCKRAGFELRGQEDFPFRGRTLHVNVWAKRTPGRVTREVLHRRADREESLG